MKRFQKITLGLICLTLPACVSQFHLRKPYDVLILNGRVLDGTGNPWRYTDIAIKEGEIVEVGKLKGFSARHIIDAKGLYVTPGFIDVHSHAGSGLTRPELSGAEPLLRQGITTVFVNPDGGGAVDLEQQRKDLLKAGTGVNVAQMVPQGVVRQQVMGMEDRAPSPDELTAMKQWVRAGMKTGAFGLSSGPFYAPGSYSSTGELIELAKVAAEYGGVYTSHIRDESDYTIGLEAAVDEVIQVAREAGLPGIVTHIKALGTSVWGISGRVCANIEKARSEGVEVFADQYPYTASATGLVSALVPRWAEAGGHDSLVRRLEDPLLLPEIRSAMEENLARRGGGERIQFRSPASIEGRKLSELAREAGLSSLDMAVELIRKGKPRIVSFNMNEADVCRFMQQSWTMTSSDGGLSPMGEGVPHPRNYGAFSRKIRKYVREEKVISLEEAVRSMTSLPALVFGLPDRGQIREGARADVLVFDPDRVTDKATFQDPHQLSEGMVHVLVNGRFAIRESDLTNHLAGEVLMHPIE